MRFSILFTLSLVCLAVSCKKKQPQPDASLNCDCAKEVSADFKMGEVFGEQFIELDTIAMPIGYYDGNPANFGYLNTVYVHFSADIKNAISYEWQVGSNSIIQTTKDFGLYFSDTIGTIPVRLIVHAKPNKICFPNDDGVDTLVKYLTIRNVIPDPLTGKYYGYNTNDPTHFFTVEVDTARRYESFFPNGYFLGLCMRNLPEGKQEWVGLGSELGSTTRCFTSASDDYQPYTENVIVYDLNSSILEQSTNGIYDPKTNKITINYYSAPVLGPFLLGTPFPKRTFIGTKIQ
jgi:hypothetical protein